MIKVLKYLFILIISLLLITCEKEEEYSIVAGAACGSIQFVSKIGSDYNSALDSLIFWREQYLFFKDFYVEEYPLFVDFGKHVRELKVILFRDATNSASFSGMQDVLDTDGNWYDVNHCPD